MKKQYRIEIRYQPTPGRISKVRMWCDDWSSRDGVNGCFTLCTTESESAEGGITTGRFSNVSSVVLLETREVEITEKANS